MRRYSSRSLVVFISIFFCFFRTLKALDGIEKPTTGRAAYDLQERYKKVQKSVEDIKRRIRLQDNEIGKKELILKGLSLREDEIDEQEKEKLKEEIAKSKQSLASDQSALQKTIQDASQLKSVLTDKDTQILLRQYVEDLGALINQPEKKSNDQPAKSDSGVDAPGSLPANSPLQIIPRDVLPREPEEVSLWQRVQARISIFFNERKATLYELLGKKEYVAEIRKNLDGLYAQFGRGGLLNRARNYKKLASLIDVYQDRIKNYINAINRYQEVLENNTLNQSKKSAISQEMQAMIVDVLLLAKATRENISPELSQEIDQKVSLLVSSVIKDSLVVGALRERTGVQDRLLDSEQIKLLHEGLQKKMIDAFSMLSNDPFNKGNNKTLQAFWDDVGKLDNVSEFKNLANEQKVSIAHTLKTIYYQYKNILENKLKEANSPDEIKELLSTLLAVAKIDFKNNALFNDLFLNYVEQNTDPNTSYENKNVLNSLQQKEMKSVIKNQLDILLKQINNPESFLKQYNALNQAIDSINNQLNGLTITADSIDMRMWINSDIYSELNKKITNPESQEILSVWPTQFFEDLQSRIRTISNQATVDQASLIRQATDTGEIGVVRESERLSDTLPYPKNLPETGGANNMLLKQLQEGVKLRKAGQGLPSRSAVPSNSAVAKSLAEILSERIEAARVFDIAAESSDEAWDE